jgi:hypothetical protein
VQESRDCHASPMGGLCLGAGEEEAMVVVLGASPPSSLLCLVRVRRRPSMVVVLRASLRLNNDSVLTIVLSLIRGRYR